MKTASENSAGYACHTLRCLAFPLSHNPPVRPRASITQSPDGKDGCRAENTGLPCADVLEYHLKGQNKLIIRPSGTEPKIKVYLSAAGKSNAGVEAINTTLTNAVFNLVKSIAFI